MIYHDADESGIAKDVFQNGSGLVLPDRGLSRFAKVMLQGDVRGMNRYLNDIVLNTMSSFGGGKTPSVRLPEYFYHGLVLGLRAESSRDALRCYWKITISLIIILSISVVGTSSSSGDGTRIGYFASQ